MLRAAFLAWVPGRIVQLSRWSPAFAFLRLPRADVERIQHFKENDSMDEL